MQETTNIHVFRHEGTTLGQGRVSTGVEGAGWLAVSEGAVVVPDEVSAGPEGVTAGTEGVMAGTELLPVAGRVLAVVDWSGTVTEYELSGPAEEEVVPTAGTELEVEPAPPGWVTEYVPSGADEEAAPAGVLAVPEGVLTVPGGTMAE